jgi:hypothetical protein
MGLKISYRLDGDIVVLTACRSKLLRSEAAPVQAWPTYNPALRSILAEIQDKALSLIEGADGRLLAKVTDFEIHLHPELAADLSATAATRLGLPTPTSLVLDLRSEKLIPDKDFIVHSRWVRPGGGPVRGKLFGALIEHDGEFRRVPQPIYSIARAALALSQPTEEAERYRALAQLQRALPEAAADAFQANGYLSETRIHYASTFSLKLGGEDPFDFDPVLFGQVSSPQEGQDIRVDEDADSILAPRAQRIFARERFRQSPDVKPAYVLRDGEYVYLDPALRPVLSEVRRIQEAPAAERRNFVLNPRRVLRERLGDDQAEILGLEGLFLETEQYSARVTGVDVWTKPVLPWLKPAPGTWLPEAFGVKVGDAFVTLQPEMIEGLIVQVELAMATNIPSVHVEGIELPASQQTVEALHSDDERRAKA